MTTGSGIAFAATTARGAVVAAALTLAGLVSAGLVLTDLLLTDLALADLVLAGFALPGALAAALARAVFARTAFSTDDFPTEVFLTVAFTTDAFLADAFLADIPALAGLFFAAFAAGRAGARAAFLAVAAFAGFAFAAFRVVDLAKRCSFKAAPFITLACFGNACDEPPDRKIDAKPQTKPCGGFAKMVSRGKLSAKQKGAPETPMRPSFKLAGPGAEAPRKVQSNLSGDPSEVTAFRMRHWITSFHC